jgi:hypothetical protein
MTIEIPARAIKLTIPIALADFPVTVIPPPGTPGAKALIVEIEVRTPEGVPLKAILKGQGLQKLAKAIAEAGEAPPGFVVLQGKLGPDGVVAEAGVIYQPGRVQQAAPAAEQAAA